MRNLKKGIGLITIAISFYACGSRKNPTDPIAKDTLNHTENNWEDENFKIEEKNSRDREEKTLSMHKTSSVDHHNEFGYNDEKLYNEK